MVEETQHGRRRDARAASPSSTSRATPASPNRRSRWSSRRQPLVAEATRERVNEAMTALGYIYHRGAATLRGAKSGVLGMVINDLSNPFFVEMAIGIEEACQGGAFIPFLANTVENPVRQPQVIRSMREHGAAGLVLSPAIGTSPAS